MSCNCRRESDAHRVGRNPRPYARLCVAKPDVISCHCTITTKKGIKDGPEMLAGDEILATAILARLLNVGNVLDIKVSGYHRCELEAAALVSAPERSPSARPRRPPSTQLDPARNQDSASRAPRAGSSSRAATPRTNRIAALLLPPGRLPGRGHSPLRERGGSAPPLRPRETSQPQMQTRRTTCRANSEERPSLDICRGVPPSFDQEPLLGSLAGAPKTQGRLDGENPSRRRREQDFSAPCPNSSA